MTSDSHAKKIFLDVNFIFKIVEFKAWAPVLRDNIITILPFIPFSLRFFLKLIAPNLMKIKHLFGDETTNNGNT